LDPDDHLALCLARDGERQTFSILETPMKFRVAWEAQYEIDGDAFTLVMKDGGIRTILGYPVTDIERRDEGSHLHLSIFCHSMVL